MSGRTDSDDVIQRVRTFCLAYPASSEKEAWGEATFRVADKQVCQVEDNHHNSGRLALWCKAGAGVQAAIIEAHPDRYFFPPYVGHRGWLGVELAAIGDDELTAICREAFRTVAPSAVRRLLDPG